MSETYNPACTRCPRLARHLKQVRKQYPDYHGRPVPAFGASRPRLLIVGLAPGLHGANASGRPFTGDFAGILLYRALHHFGYGNRPESVSANDGLKLSGVRITNAVKCLPPENKPIGSEVNNCNEFLVEELRALGKRWTVLALGGIAHRAVVRALGERQKDYAFGHGAVHAIDSHKYLVDSYHCSRYNTQTGRLTEAMFFEVFEKIRGLD